MSTAQDLIQAALEELGVYAPGETLTAADSSRGLWALNAMLDSWSNESLACFALQTYTLPLVVGKQSYTIGAGGDLSTNRPISLKYGPGAAFVTDATGNRYPVDVIPQDQWNQIGLLSSTSQIPTMLFYDPQYPLGVLNVFPVPTIQYGLTFEANLPFADFATLQTVMSLPPGYQDAIQHNLAIRLHPYFKNGPINPLLVELASTTKAAVKRSNLKLNVARYDAEIVSRGTPTYNIFRNSNNGS